MGCSSDIRSCLAARGTRRARRGIILPIALLVIGLLAALAATVVFRSNADLAAVHAAEASLHARLAAEAGVQKAIAILQGGEEIQLLNGPTGMDIWYDNPEAFAAVDVRGDTDGFGAQQAAATPSGANPPVWRFSLVGNDPAAQPGAPVIRYGLTDEASKLNINTATRRQLAALISQVHRQPDIDPYDLARAIVYWRTRVREGQEDQAEDTWYQSMEPPYLPKHAPFESVEELLLVRGMSGPLLYGEDFNRNGILDPEENDGDDGVFPPDNGDSLLDRGLYPFVTVWSSEPNLSSQNKPRVYLNAGNSSTADLLNSLPDTLTDDQKAAILARKQKGSLGTPLDLLIVDEDSEAYFSKEDLPMLLDEFTCRRAQVLTGLVNVNTAPFEVLMAIGFTEQEAHAIITARQATPAEDRTTLAWLIDQGIVEIERLNDPALFNSLTARSFQYRVEAVGFADHVGTYCRIEAILKIQSPLPVPQVVYWRDLTSLGIGWPVRGQEGTSFALNANG